MRELSGSLHVEVDGERLEMRASGTDLVVDVEHSRTVLTRVRSLWRNAPLARVLVRRLHSDGLTLTVICRGTTLVRAGFGVRGSLVGRLLGLRHLDVFPKSERP